MIIGTAGHIDHGKTSLVRKLTGIDTDRLPEEVLRGMTIDLGFAHAELDGVGRIAMVDVPGHERFIRNMVAGVTGIDVVLLVVAADDGIMPQTREHLDIVRLLGVREGVVAVTKIDLASEERIAAVQADVRKLISDTPFADAPVVPVSSLTEAGLPCLRTALAASATRLQRRSTSGPFWMGIDRVFHSPGFGVVTTGTIGSGQVQRGHEVKLLPGGQLLRVRGLQNHGDALEEAGAAMRCALNLARIEKSDITRGMVVCDAWMDGMTDTVDVTSTLSREIGDSPKSGTRIRVHAGTWEALARLHWLDQPPAPGEKGLMQLRMERAVPLLHGQSFILRDENAQRTIAGGRVLDTRAKRRGAKKPERTDLLHILEDEDLGSTMTALLASRGVEGWMLHELAEQIATTPEALSSYLTQRADARVDELEGTLWVGLTSELQALATRVEAWVASYLQQHSQRNAVAHVNVHLDLCPRLDLRIFRSVIAQLVRDKRLEASADGLRPRGYRQAFVGEDALLAQRIESLLLFRRTAIPKLNALCSETGKNVAVLRRFLAAMEHASRVVRLGEGVYVLRSDFNVWRQAAISHLQRQGELSVVQFRDQIGFGRDLCIMFLEWLDREGVTMRQRETRVPGPKFKETA